MTYLHIGLLTVGLGNMPFEKKVEWAAQQGFQTLEVGCWPANNTRDYSSTDIDVDALTPERAEEIQHLLEENHLSVSALAYYDNNLDCDPEKRQFVNNHLRKCIDAAVLLGTDMVGTFIGRDITKSVVENFDEMEKVFGPILRYAEDRGIKIIIENCHMPDWLEPGKPGTISYSPELLQEMFKRLPNKNFGLNYDPSHLLTQLIDYQQVLFALKDRIFHVHAKDAEVFQDKLRYYGIYNNQLGNQNDGFWRYRMPGSGQVDWAQVFENLKKIGYDGVISIEHEDPEYEGSEEKLKEGISKGLQYLKKFI